MNTVVGLSRVAISPSKTAIMSGVMSATSQKRRRVANRQVMTEMATSSIQIVGGIR
jgi:hypothetical protein